MVVMCNHESIPEVAMQGRQFDVSVSWKCIFRAILFLATGRIVPTTLYQIYNSIAARIIGIAPEEVVFAH
jgi:hypothetical protein